MIVASRGAWMLALALAIGVHAALVWTLMSGDGVEIESGGGAVKARVGASFADMAAGTIQAAGAEEVLKPDTPNTVQPVRAAQMPPTPTTRQAAVPALTETPRETAEYAIPTAAAPTANTVAHPTAPTAPPDAVTARGARKVVSAKVGDEPAVARSLRPKRRSEAFEDRNAGRAAASRPEKKRQRKAQKRGNAQQDARAGAAADSDTVKPAASGTRDGGTSTSGKAAASNYPGRVMQRISRVPRPRVGSRGTVVVAFRVSGSGTLAGVSVARSSGSGALDRAALRMIRSAAPFPAPPSGARRSFSISVEGR